MPEWLPALMVLAGSVAIGYLTRAVIARRLAKLFARTATDLDDLILAAIRRHLPLWFFLGGVVLALPLAPVPERAVLIVDRLCAVAFVLSLSFAAANLGASFLGRFRLGTGGAVASTSLAQNVLRGLVLLGGGLLVLTNLGISITPLLTALGVGSLAVALALQPTLSNLFAGLHLAISRPIRVGDFIQLEAGTKGYVEDIGWRATRIRELPNNIIVVPNSRVVDMVLTNYSLPVLEQSVLVQVGISYGSDLVHVEHVTCEVARQVLQEVQGGVADFQPFIRYHTFGDSSINFTVILRVREFTDRYLVSHEFIKRLKARYDDEGIEIPFPQRVLHGSAAMVHPPPQVVRSTERG